MHLGKDTSCCQKKLLYSKKNMRLNKFAKKCNKIKKKKEKIEICKSIQLTYFRNLCLSSYF